MPQGKKSTSNLGRAIIRDRFKSKGHLDSQWVSPADAVQRETPEAALLKSITAPSDLDEFLATATLAGTEFEAVCFAMHRPSVVLAEDSLTRFMDEFVGILPKIERYNLKLVAPNPREGVLSAEEQRLAKTLQDSYKGLLTVPRRPKWDSTTSPEELDEKERRAFLDWRQQLSEIADVETLIVTPYERNLEVWKQLWRVLERSDVVVQIVDARNPLLYYCDDLSKYVSEINSDKQNLVLVNKGDLLPEHRRAIWAEYFSIKGLKAVFFSALLSTEQSNREHSETHVVQKVSHQLDLGKAVAEEEDIDTSDAESSSSSGSLSAINPTETVDNDESSKEEVYDDLLPSVVNDTLPHFDVRDLPTDYRCSSHIFSREELMLLFRNIHKDKKTVLDGVTTVGFVGYPNVGKSSTLNSLMQNKKVSVSATPGKTKHFQTIYIDDELMLCDCPGLVMPSFAMNAAEMIVSGILPIDQLRDFISPINLICSRIPRSVLEAAYGVTIPFIREYGIDYHIIPPPTAEEFLAAYATLRGFVTARGLPDISRVARHVLKDYVNGKLIFCHAPPGLSQTDFLHFSETTIQTKERSAAENAEPEGAHSIPQVSSFVSHAQDSVVRQYSLQISSKSAKQRFTCLIYQLADLGTKSGRIDRDFFSTNRAGIYEKRNGVTGVRGPVPVQDGGQSTKRHFKKNKKEKLRRIFRELDLH